jgi:hypothetical protein
MSFDQEENINYRHGKGCAVPLCFSTIYGESMVCCEDGQTTKVTQN